MPRTHKPTGNPRGRPSLGLADGGVIYLRLPADLREALDHQLRAELRANNPGAPSESEMVRSLLREALTARGVL